MAARISLSITSGYHGRRKERKQPRNRVFTAAASSYHSA